MGKGEITGTVPRQPRGLPPLVDKSIAALILAASGPAMIVAAVAVKLDTPGPVLFRQTRIGRDGRSFIILKFRTFHHNAPREGVWVPLSESDPRITRTGRWLRRTSLDELPNLVNVLRGEMALVGPRPTIAEQVAEYSHEQRRRLDVLPGITGWAQVNGRADLSWSRRMELDIWYVDNRNPALDAKIMWCTLRLVCRGGGSRSVVNRRG